MQLISKKRSKRSRRVEPETPPQVEPQPIGPTDQPVTDPNATTPAAAAAPDGGDLAAAPKPKKKKKPRQPAPDAAPGAPTSSPFPF